jgi:hypothetical protein
VTAPTLRRLACDSCASAQPLSRFEIFPVFPETGKGERRPSNTMPKFMSSHTVPAGAHTREQINQIAQAAQNDPMVQPYRSFLNLSEGKIVCIMQAPDDRALATWFQKMQMPCDSITAVELEGDLGTVKEA